MVPFSFNRWFSYLIEEWEDVVVISYGLFMEEQENETNKDDLLAGHLGPFGNNLYRDKITTCPLS